MGCLVIFHSSRRSLFVGMLCRSVMSAWMDCHLIYHVLDSMTGRGWSIATAMFQLGQHRPIPDKGFRVVMAGTCEDISLRTTSDSSLFVVCKDLHWNHTEFFSWLLG